MLAVFERTVASVEMFLISIPESIGLLIFGIVLVAVAVVIRRLISRPIESKKKPEPAEEALAK